jgi:hypothetical protein
MDKLHGDLKHVISAPRTTKILVPNTASSPGDELPGDSRADKSTPGAHGSKFSEKA